MYKTIAVLLLVAILVVGAPAPAKAQTCGVLCSWFGFNGGFTDRTKIKQEEETERARIQAEAEQRMAEINRQAAEAVEQAKAEVERAKNERYADQYARDVAIANAQAQVEQYNVMVDAWRQTQIRTIEVDTDRALAAIHSQTDLGLKAIETAGEVKRWALTTDMVWSVVLIVGLIFLGWRFLGKQGQGQTIYVLPGPGHRPHQLPPGYRAHLPQGHDQQEIMIYEDHQ